MGKKEEILAILKEDGLIAAEEVAVESVEKFCSSLIKIAKLFSAGAGGVTEYIVGFIKPKVLAALDKIDGQDNPTY